MSQGKRQTGSGTCAADGPTAAARGSLALFAFLLVAVVVGAAVFRTVDLGNRPMHCDEGNHGIKFGKLLEKDEYEYDPWEYHGPSLNYLTLPIAWASGKTRLVDVTEADLRLLPAIFGTILVGLVWLLREELGYPAALCAALLAAVSPAMVFYSRYYIQEMLLVCFTFGAIVALWRYRRVVMTAEGDVAERPRSWGREVGWLVLLGVCIGMAHASKETVVIALFAMAVAAVPTLWKLRYIGLNRSIVAGVVVLLVTATVSAIFFSSFGNHLQGVVDSYSTYFYYLGRASGEGSAGRHYYPWFEYFQRLFWFQQGDGPVWTEASIAALALVGMTAAAIGRGIGPRQLPLARFLTIYTLLLVAVYSAMPYKTPWCALGFLHGLILLAGIGAAVLIRVMPHWSLKALPVLLVVAAAGHLAWQAHRASFVDYEDPNNPYVYAHTTSDVQRLCDVIRRIAAVQGDGPRMDVQFICPDHDYWPFPWYLRDMQRVRWCGEPPPPTVMPAPLIVTQPELVPQVLQYAYYTPPPGQRDLYAPLAPKDPEKPWWLIRPNVPLEVYLKRDLKMEYDEAE